MTARRIQLAFVLIATIVLLGACGTSGDGAAKDTSKGGGEDEVTTTSEATSTTRRTTTTRPTTTTTSIPTNAVGGDFAVTGGIHIKVNNAYRAASVLMNQTGFQPDGELAEFTEFPAGDGAEFIVIEATVRNEGQRGIDLTCTSRLATKVLDNDEREYSRIEDLYDIQGNPTCNSLLDPGFEVPMTWVYRVPAGADIAGFYAVDATDRSVRQDPAVWRLAL